jgi:segregation and condensation protein A
MDVNLDNFQGPLDLLLSLIRRGEMDIYDIPIARLTEEYLAAIASMPPEMDELSQFLVMAATLLEIKSRMLLPRAQMDGEPEEDPREALTRQLLAYAQAQEIAEKIGSIEPQLRYAAPGQPVLLAQLTREGQLEGQPVMDLISLSTLADIFSDVLKRVEARVDTVRGGFGQMARDNFTVAEKVLAISEILVRQGRTGLVALFEACRSRIEMVVTFLAVLEMTRRGQVLIKQANSFEDVEITNETAKR